MERTSAGYPASLVIHGVAISLLILLTRTVNTPVTRPQHTVLFDPPDLHQLAIELNPLAGSGGGGRSLLPAAQGRMPMFKPEAPLAPPQQVTPVDASLPVEITLQGPDIQLANNNLKWFGDPNAKSGPQSNGRGCCGSIGEGTGRSIGNGEGDIGYGIGKQPGVQGIYRTGGGVSNPVLISQVEPEFTEAARKARHQGLVRIHAIVDSDGHVRDPQIVNALGLGLDEKAIEAVRQWKFKPAMKDGKAVPVYASIEVIFRLL